MTVIKIYLHITVLFVTLILISCAGTRKVAQKKNDIEHSHESPYNNIKIKYSRLLDVDANEINNIKLYEFIDSWYGTTYKYGGNSKSGVDCSNFASILLKNVYERNIGGSSSGIYSQCKIVEKSKLEEGDLVFFNISGDKISHVGIYLANGRFVHASTKAGVRIDDLEQEYYKKHFFSGGRLK